MSQAAYVFAQALFNHVDDVKSLRAFYQDLRGLCERLEIQTTRQLNMTMAALRKNLAHSSLPRDIYGRWLWYVTQFGDLQLLPRIADYIYDGVLAWEGTELAVIETPHALTTQQEATMKKLIEKKMAAKVACDFRVNPEVLAGFRVWCKGYLWDASVQGWSHRILQQVS